MLYYYFVYEKINIVTCRRRKIKRLENHTEKALVILSLYDGINVLLFIF